MSFASAAALRLVLALLFSLTALTQPARAADRIRVAVTENLHSAPLLLAAEGPAAANGLEIELKRFQAGFQAVTALENGEADFAPITEFALSARNLAKTRVRIVAVIAIYKDQVIVARRDRGIAVPADLRGKSIGVVATTSSEYFLDGFLLSHSLRRKDVSVVHLQTGQLPDALANGAVDAVSTWQPFGHDLKQRLGDRVQSWSAMGDQDGYWLLVAREQTLKEKPQTAVKLLRAIQQAEKRLKADPAGARASLQAAIGMPVAVQAELWPEYRYGQSLPQDLLLAMEAGVRWRIAAGLVPAQPVPNFLEFIDTGPLDAVQPGAVTLIR